MKQLQLHVLILFIIIILSIRFYFICRNFSEVKAFVFFYDT